MLSHQSQTAQGGYVNGFISLRSLDGWFHCPGRKSVFGLNKDENRQIEFHHVLPVFLYFSHPFPYLRTNTEMGREAGRGVPRAIFAGSRF